jgi:hypothetical protein
MEELALHRGPQKENTAPGAKLKLRRYFLRRYPHRSVLDGCHGHGALWSALRREFQVREFTALDVKPHTPDTLKIDCAVFLNRPGLAYDVVDLDTFGSPMRPWLALLKHFTRPVTVFLTMGGVKGSFACDHLMFECAGAEFHKPRLPQAMLPGFGIGEFKEVLLAHALTRPPACAGLRVVEIQEAPGGEHVRYFGLHLALRSGQSRR